MQADEEQANQTVSCLTLHPHEDIDRARDRKIAYVDGQISIARGNLLSTRSLKSDLQRPAASRRACQAVGYRLTYLSKLKK